MSQLNLKKIQLGDNADTSKNFVISVPAVADGTLVIERGNGTDVLSVAADGKVTGNFTQSVAQSWQNMTASRAAGTTYTNDTGRPIQVYVSIIGAGAGYGNFSVDGQLFLSSMCSSVGNSMIYPFTVPAGSTYVVSAGNVQSISSWKELR